MSDLERYQAEIRRLRAIISDIEEEKRKQGGIISGNFRKVNFNRTILEK